MCAQKLRMLTLRAETISNEDKSENIDIQKT